MSKFKAGACNVGVFLTEHRPCPQCFEAVKPKVVMTRAASERTVGERTIMYVECPECEFQWWIYKDDENAF
jgi:hypothetical protein